MQVTMVFVLYCIAYILIKYPVSAKFHIVLWDKSLIHKNKTEIIDWFYSFRFDVLTA